MPKGSLTAEACLYTDLGLDPATYGCQSYEATGLVARRAQIDPRSTLILWQVGAFGDHAYHTAGYDLSRLPLLLAYLQQFYPDHHEVCLYEAALFPGCQPRMDWIPLSTLPQARLNPATTLFVPPRSSRHSTARFSSNLVMMSPHVRPQSRSKAAVWACTRVSKSSRELKAVLRV